MGSSGLLCYAITKILRNKEYKIISRNKKKNFIKTNIFNKKLNLIKIKKEKWINKINDNDCMILLNNFGKISDYQNYRNKVIDFEKRIFFVLKNINKKIRIIFFSSDMVYDGKNKLNKDNTAAKPLNRYGLSKKKIENFILNNFSNHLILRLCKIFSINKKNKSFVSEIYTKIKKKKKIYLFNDQHVHYMEINEFLKKFRKIINTPNIIGVFNLPGSIFTTRFKLAKKIFPKYKNFFIPLNVTSKFRHLPARIKMVTNLNLN
jgi:dTDP-4-dehydrorhamnose reductase